MSSLLPNQQCHSTEGNSVIFHGLAHLKLVLLHEIIEGRMKGKPTRVRKRREDLNAT